MPLKNFICKENDEKVMPLEECRKCCDAWTAPCGIIPPILDSILHNIQEEQAVEGIRITSLTGCVRGEFLKRKVEYNLEPTDLHYSWRGKLFHSLFEKYTSENIIKETRFNREFEGVTITGKPDLIIPERGILVDFKSTLRVPFRKPWSNHTIQINLYRWLLERICPIDTMLVAYVDMENCAVRKADILSDLKLKNYLVKAMAINEALKSNLIPPPVSAMEDRWMCGYCDMSFLCYTLLYNGIKTLSEAK